MSIASQITTMQEHIEDIYDTFAVAGVDTSAAAKNIVNINANLKERLEYYLANGLDVVWNNWNKVSGSGTTLSLSNTIQAKMDFVCKGNTSQSILPSGYTQVDYITSDGNSYIDTGKALGDNFKIETKFIHNQQSSNEQPIISTWVNSYAWFNLYIASNNQLRFYASGNHMTANPTLTIGNINTVSYSRNDNEWVGTLNGEKVTFNTDISADNRTTFKILARGDVTLGSYVSIYRLKLFENNILTMDLIPCYRNSDNVIGMYDIVNNIFYTNSGTGNFTYGSIAPNPDCPIPVNVVTGDNEVKVEGKNLFDESNLTLATVQEDGKECYKIAGTTASTSNVIWNEELKENTQYTISMVAKRVQYFNHIVFYYKDGTNNYVNFTNTTFQRINATSQANKTLTKIRIDTGDLPAFNYIEVGTIQLEKGLEVTPYEPYQSQTYPINLGSMELCKIGDYQDYIAKSTGENLFDKDSQDILENVRIGADGGNNADSGYFISEFIEVRPNTKYTKNTTADAYHRFAFYTDKSTSSFISKNEDNTITTPSNAKYLRICGLITEKNSIMLNEGSTALPYEPYGKVWYLNKQIGKYVLDGSENWSDFSVGDTNFRCQYDVALPNILTPPTNPAQLFSNYFKAINRDNAYAKTEIGIAQYGSTLGKVFICAPNNILSGQTLASWKAWLSTHNTTIYYVLATPTITEITDTTLLSQLEAIKLSYNEQTNISQTNTGKPFILDVTALKDLDAEDTTPALATNRGLLFTQSPVSENSINDEDDNSRLEETINEEEPNIEDNNREEEEPVDFFEKEIINNDEEQEEMPTEPIEIDNGQR